MEAMDMKQNQAEAMWIDRLVKVSNQQKEKERTERLIRATS